MGSGQRSLRSGRYLCALLLLGATSCTPPPAPSNPQTNDECSDVEPCPGRVRLCERGQCVPAQRCEGLEDCPGADADGDPLLCENGLCLEFCRPGPGWCPHPQTRCELESHTCVRRPQLGRCNSHDDCPSPDVCSPTVDDDSRARRCQVGDRCGGDGDCAASRFGALCQEGSCVECRAHADCPATSPRCVAFGCVEERPLECVDDLECCPTDVQCALRCNLESGRCEEGVDCRADIDCLSSLGRYCDLDAQSGRGLCAPPCTDPRAVCAPGKRCLPNGRCGSECGEDSDCGLAMRCDEGRCVQPPPDGVFFCESLEDCPNREHGGECVGGICREAPSCAEHGEPDTCLGSQRVCDFDPFAGEALIRCQAFCDLRDVPVCPDGSYCDVEGGRGLCTPPAPIVGCMTSEMCGPNEICDRHVPIPRCVRAAAAHCRANSECGPQDQCVDDQCSPVYPYPCTESLHCAGRQICNLDGACELAQPCSRQGQMGLLGPSEDCPGGLQCNQDNGRCDECAQDLDCGPLDSAVHCGSAPSGRYRRCVEGPNGFCQEDTDCVARRQCRNGFCSPAPCEDDWMHRIPPPGQPRLRGNHAPTHAAPVGGRTFVELRYCDGADDWFSVPLDQGQGLQATIRWDAHQDHGDLALELRHGNELLDRSDGIGGSEQVGLNAAPIRDNYLLRVTGAPGASASYQLQVDLGETCADDPYEGPQGNDEIERAWTAQPGLLSNLILCRPDSQGSSRDWFRLEAGEGSNLRIAMDWDPADGNLVATLVDSQRRVIQPPIQGQGAIHYELSDWREGPLFLELRADAENPAELRYDLRIQSSPSAERVREVCERAPALPIQWELMDPEADFPTRGMAILHGDLSAEPDLSNAWAGSCDPERDVHIAREKVWRLDTTAPEFHGLTVNLTLLYRNQDPEFQGVVYLRGDCEDDAMEKSCRLGPRRPYQLNALPPAVYYIVVDGRGESMGPFELTVQVHIDTDRMPNPCDSCLNSCPLPPWQPAGPNQLHSQVLSFTDHAEPDERGMAQCIDRAGASAGPDVVYVFETEQDCRFSARLTPEAFLAGLVLRDGCPATEEIACRYANDFEPKLLSVPRLPAGSYSLWVKGASALQFGEFELDVSCSDPALAPPGDSCETAIPVDLEPLLSRRGDLLGHQATLLGDNIGTRNLLDDNEGCGGLGPLEGGEVIYSISLDEPSHLFVDLTADYEAVATVRRHCAEGGEGSILACGTEAQPIQIDDLEPGDYFLSLDTVDPQGMGLYTVNLTTLISGVELEQPDNDSCEAPRELPFRIGGRETLDGQTFTALDDATPPPACGEDLGGKDLVYHYVADQDHRLRARVFGNFPAQVYLRRGRCDDPVAAFGPRAEMLGCAENILPDTALGPGSYYLFVDGQRGPIDQGSFTLQVEWLQPIGECPFSPNNCISAQPIPLVDGRAEVIGSTAFCEANEQPIGCGPPEESGRDVVYAFDLEQASTLRATLVADFPAVLYLRDGGCAPEAELYCSSNHPARLLSREALPPGRYFLVVDTEFADNQGGGFELGLEAIPISPPPLNDTCELVNAAQPDPQAPGLNGRVLLDANGRATIHGTTEGARADNEIRPYAEDYPAACADSPGRDTRAARDVVYRIDVESVSRLVAEVVPDGQSDAVLSLRGPGDCANRAAEQRCGDEPARIVVEELEPGPWYLVVDGYDAAYFGSFELHIELLPRAPRPTNDDCHAFTPFEASMIPLELIAGPPGRATGHMAGSTQEAADDYEPIGCARSHDTGPDVVFAVELPFAWNQLDLSVRDLSGGADLVAYLRNGEPTCHDGEDVEGACSDDRNDQSRDPHIQLGLASRNHLPGGLYFLFVDGFSTHDVSDGFEIEIGVDELIEEIPQGDGCLDEANIPLLQFDPEGPEDQAISFLSGDTTWAHNFDIDVARECVRPGPGGKDVVHLLRLEDDYLIEASVVGQGWFSKLSLRGVCDDPSTELGCGEQNLGPLALSAGDYFLWVDGIGPEDWGPYALQVRRSPITRRPCNNLCGSEPVDEHCPQGYGPEPLAFENDSAFVDGWIHELTQDTEDASCGGIGGGELIYRIDLDAPAAIDVWIPFSSFRPRIYLRSECAQRETELSCHDQRFRSPRLEAGSYYLFVDGRDADQQGRFSMTVSLDRSPLNDSCDAPALLDLGREGRISVGGSLSMAADDHHASCGGDGGHDVVYALEVQSQSRLAVQTRGEQQVVVYMTTERCEPAADNEVVCGAAGFEREGVEPGTYWIHVDAAQADGFDGGGFTLEVELTAEAPPNDICGEFDGAPGFAELELGERGAVQMPGRTRGASNDSLACPRNNDGADVFYAFNIPAHLVEQRASFEAPLDLEVSLSFDGDEQRAFDHSLALQDTVCQGALLGCSDPNDKLIVPDLETGRYILSVDGVAEGQEGPFELHAALPMQHNASCEGAEPIQVNPCVGDCAAEGGEDPVHHRIRGSLVGATTAYWTHEESCSTQGTVEGRDVLYKLELEQPLEWLQLQVSSTHFEPTFWLVAETCPLGQSFGCWFGEEIVQLDRVPAGEHWLIIDGGPRGLGDFELTVRAGPAVSAPSNQTCAEAEEIPIVMEPGIPLNGFGAIRGSTLAASADYKPTVCEHLEGSEELLEESPDVVYCLVIDTQGQDLDAAIDGQNVGAALGFSPVLYLYRDLDPFGGSGAVCTQDAPLEGEDCAQGEICCPQPAELCRDFEGDGVRNCVTLPSCDEEELDAECLHGNPIQCGVSIQFAAIVGGLEAELAGGNAAEGLNPELADPITHSKYYVVADGIGGRSGDFELNVRLVGVTANCTMDPVAENEDCPEGESCCSVGSVCRCMPPYEVGQRPPGCEPGPNPEAPLENSQADDPACCIDTDGPPQCVDCTRNLDCGPGQICDLHSHSCIDGCARDQDCRAPAFCSIPPGANFGKCVACALSDACQEDDDCEPIDGRPSECQPDGRCSECVQGRFCIAGGCVACRDEEDCVGALDQHGNATPLCHRRGDCVQCAPEDRCEHDGDCGPGQRCDNLECTRCPQGQFCTDTNLCGVCENDSDCEAGLICDPHTASCREPLIEEEEGARDNEAEGDQEGNRGVPAEGDDGEADPP